jgi:hypothetical protein
MDEQMRSTRSAPGWPMGRARNSCPRMPTWGVAAYSNPAVAVQYVLIIESPVLKRHHATQSYGNAP